MRGIRTFYVLHVICNEQDQYNADLAKATRAANACVNAAALIVDRGTKSSTTQAAYGRAEAAALSKLGLASPRPAGPPGGLFDGEGIRERQEKAALSLTHLGLGLGHSGDAGSLGSGVRRRQVLSREEILTFYYVITM